MEENAKKLAIISGVSAAVVLLLSLFIVVVIQTFAIAPLKREKAQREAYLAEILAMKDETEDAIEYLKGTKFIEEYARYILGWGKPGTIKYQPKG